MKALRAFRRFLDTSPWYVRSTYFFLTLGVFSLIRGYSLGYAVFSGAVFSFLMTILYALYGRRRRARKTSA